MYKAFRNIILLFILASPSFIVAQKQTKIDSLESLLKNSRQDSAKIKILGNLCTLYGSLSSVKAMTIAEQGLDLAKNHGRKSDEAFFSNKIGENFRGVGDYNKAIEYHSKALKLYENLDDELGIANSMASMANVYTVMGNYKIALDFHLKALKIREDVGDQKQISSSLTNIGAVHYRIGNFNKTIEYWQRSLEIDEQMGDKSGISKLLNNLGLVYEAQGKYENALMFHERSLELKKSIGDKAGIASSLNNIGNVNYHMKKYDMAINYWKKSLKIKVELGDREGIANTLGNLGQTFSELKNREKAIEYLNKSLAIAEEIGSKHYMKEAYSKLSSFYNDSKDYEKALKYHQLLSQMKDSLLNEQNSKQMAEMEAIYESEKKEQEIKLLTKDNQLLEKDNELKVLELNRNRIMVYGLSGGFAMLLILAFVIYRGYRQKQTANMLLADKNLIIEQKNKDITDSIQYAKNLQEAILPDSDLIGKALPNHFIYFRPKDIVSGDFFWFHEKENKIFIAAADCTGHGVPGAFVSMTCHNELNRAIIEKDMSDPGQILTEVNDGVVSAFKKQGAKSQASDGMDIALCVINRNPKQIQFAGALRPMLICNNGNTVEVAGDRRPIGGRTEADYQFNTRQQAVQDGDFVYIFSDGYADQFGGTKGKKFKYKPFVKMLCDLSSLPATEQKENLHKTLVKWQGNNEPVDDILILGFEV